MWFGKSIMTKLGLVMALAVPALAADVAPFVFSHEDGSAVPDQQKYWDNLMKYKMFGAHGIIFRGRNIKVTDSSGWFGTASGPFDMSSANDEHTVGGPILIGGKILLSNGNDLFSTGPVRVTDDITLGNYSTWSGTVYGPQCLSGNVHSLYNNAIQQKPVYGQANCPDTVPQINSQLRIPVNPASNFGTNLPSYEMDNTMAIIDVPAGSGPYDYYVDHFTFANNSVLLIRMPYGGRLTRIFVKNGFDFGSAHPKVRIAYVDSTATWTNGRWSADASYDANAQKWSISGGAGVENKDYAGNLLFYTPNDIHWAALVHADSMQGTYISTGTIYIEQQMTLAGQLLADVVSINANFDGSGFRFVPFDPDTLNIDPKAISGGKFPENNRDALVPIKLDSKAQIDVHFEYCFDVVGKGAGYAEKADFQITTLAPLPICGVSKKSVSIKRDAYEPADDQKIYINVWKDGVKEPDEKLILKISNLTGAVMPNNLRDGEFELTIADMNGPEFNDDVKSYNVNENTAAKTLIATIPIKNVEIPVADTSKFKLIVGGADSAAVIPVFNFELVKNAVKDPAVVDTAYIKISVKTTNLDYETLSKTAYKVTLRLDNAGTISDSTTRTINVIDVNEKPVLNDTTLSVAENRLKGTTVGTIAANDPDTKNPAKFGVLEYTIIDTGVPFSITTASNKGTIKTTVDSLDYETTPDHKYEFDVRVINCERDNSGNKTNKCLYDTAHVVVNVTDENEPPVIIDDGKTFDIDENTPTSPIALNAVVGKLEVKDVDGVDVASKLVVSYVVTDDATSGPKFDELFTVTDHAVLDDAGKMWLVVSVNDPTIVDYESIKSSYSITMTVKDHGGAAGSNVVTVKKTIVVKDVNEAPVITGVRGENDGLPAGETRENLTLYPVENLAKDAPIGVVLATDPDSKNAEYRHLEYRIIPDAANPVPFYMNGGTDATIYVGDASKMNHEDDIVYTFDVEVSNCLKNASTGKYTESCLADTATITVKIQNVPEDPKINCFTNDTPQGCKVSDVYENTAVGKLVHAFQIIDPDKGQAKNMDSVWLADKKSGGKAATYFEAVTNGDSLKIVVKSNINYEALPKDTIFNVRLTVRDNDGKTATFDYRIDLVDVNEAPVFASNDTTISVKENTPNGSVVGKLPASDPDTLHVKKFGHLEYSIIDREANNIPFDMDSNKIVVTNVKALDYEALQPTATFEFKVLVANCELNASSGKYDGACLYDTAKVSLKVTDEPEKTIIIPPCQGSKCSECVGETCVEEIEELCTEHCDTPRDTTSSTILTLSVKENSKTGFVIADYLVRDQDVGTGHKDTLVATLKNTNASGADSLFVVNMKKDASGDWRLVVSVKDSSKLDFEKIKASHDVTISVKDPADPAGMGDVIYRIIKVVDVNEAPEAKDATIKPNENLPKGTVIGKLEVTEPDTKNVKKFGHLEYSIIGKDSTFAFAMDSNKVLVNDASKMDYELAVHDYTFDVQIANCELNSTSGKYDGACLYDTAKVTVNIQNVNEPPTIVIDGPDIPDGHDDSDSLCIAFCDTTSRGVKNKDTILTVGIRENPDDPNDSTGKKIILSPTGMILFQYHVVDEDTNHASKAKVSWFDAASTIPGVSTTGSDLFTIEYDAVKHVITVRVKDEKLLDYEALRNAKNRNDPDPEYTMGIVVMDPDSLADTLYRKIRITDENEKPFFEVWPLVITENNHIGDSLGHVEHPSDIDSLSRNSDLYDNGFKMTGGNTELFQLVKDSTDLMRVMLLANVVLDCENGEYVCGQDSAYWVELIYGDTTLNTVYTDLKVPVKLIDLNEPPQILTDTLGVDENSPKGTPLDTIKWFDYDRFDTVMSFKIVDDPTGCFTIDNKTGLVSVKKDKCAGLDYEKNGSVTIRVSVTDMVNVKDTSMIAGGPITITKEIKVNIHDVNEPPSISDKTIAVPESTTVWTVIDTVKATDPDKKKEFSTLTYTAVSGDTAVFMIDPHTGAVILKDTLDYESKKSYVVYVQVDDGEFTDTAKVKINVTNVLEQSEVIITKYENRDTTWNYPDTVYTNLKNGVLTWRQDGEIVSADTTLKKGKNVIIITYKDPSKDLPGKDTVVIMYNDEIPLVEVTANPTHVKAENVFTIVENTGAADTNIYVNKERDSVYVHVKDPANKRDTSFALEVNLEPAKVSDATLKKMNSIADSKIMLDETPSSGVTRTAVNSDTEKMSYTQLIGSDTVTVSYMVDKSGDPIKVPVINSKGKEEKVEVITVTYKTMVGDQEVEISYIADAMTGEIFAKGPNGELMVQGASSKGSKSGKDKDSEKNSNVSEGIFSVTTVKIDQLGSPMVVSYAVDEKGNMVKNAEGDIGYSVTYSYKNIYGNIATESVFIVLDQTFPTVEILSPITYSIVRSNFVEVKWTVNGIEQDSLTLQGLEKGPNIIVRFYRDKAGNEASDTVSVMMKDSKNVNIAVEQPVTEIDKDKVEEYYSVNPPKKGETFAVSIKNPSTGKEVETQIGGHVKSKEGSGEEPYPGMEDAHLGPTLSLDIKLPVIVPKEGYGTVSGLATLDDLVVSDGMIPLEGVDADNATKITVEEYVEKYCEDGVKVPSDISQFNLYDSKLHAKIWVYTSLGNFVDYFNFTQDLNDPEFTDEAGVLNLYFEQKPDKNGYVKADNGKQYATGAYVYKVEATIRSKLRCTLPSSDFDAKLYKKTGDGFGPSAKRKGDVIKNSDELLKSFGYRRPKH